MKEPNPSIGILDYLKEEAGCTYISDLYQISFLPSIKKVVEQIDPDTFTLRQWNDAAGYISQKKLEFHTVQEVRGYLLEL